MSQSVTELRRFWLDGLNEVVGNPDPPDLRAWIGREEFQVYASEGDPFHLNFSDSLDVRRAIAGEVQRFSLAALETKSSIQRTAILPKSTAWAIVQWYYAAFYAAHAILRMCGTSLVQLENGHAKDICRVAGNYGYVMTATAGFHKAEVLSASKQVRFERMTGGKGGSHQYLWKMFDQWLKACEQDLLLSPGASTAIQDLAQDLAHIRGVLSREGHSHAGWLSHVRNRVNYRHEYSAWFPYRNFRPSQLSIYDLNSQGGGASTSAGISRLLRSEPIPAFVGCCQAITSICEELCQEMAKRCPQGQSFQHLGSVHLENILGQR